MTDIIKSAVLSPCRRYRWSLTRTWDQGEMNSERVMFVGLNPSTADETEDDATIRKCMSFAKSWGYTGLVMTNLFAYRATEPKDMLKAGDPVGLANNAHLLREANFASLLVAAWGTHGGHLARNAAVRELLPNLHHLGLTKDGHPRHPLYLKGDTKPQIWR